MASNAAKKAKLEPSCTNYELANMLSGRKHYHHPRLQLNKLAMKHKLVSNLKIKA